MILIESHRLLMCDSITAVIKTQVVLFCLLSMVSACCHPGKNNSIIATGRQGSYNEILFSVQENECAVDNEFGYVASVNIIQLQWYLLKENNSKQEQLALNITWIPDQFASVEELKGFKVTILYKNFWVNEIQYYCLHTKLQNDRHIQAVFHYCFLPTVPLQPGEELLVRVDTIPEPYPENKNLSSLGHQIKAPVCGHGVLKDSVEMCALTIHEIQIMCENRSIVLDYSVPNIYGNTVTVLFCHPGQGINYCGAEILILRNQPLRSMLVLSLPEHEKQSLEYIVIVQTTHLVKKSLLISFHECNESSYPTPIFTYLTVPVFILPVVCFLVYVLYCKKCTLHQNIHTNKSQPAFQPSSKISKIYIIFVDDHPLHIEVVIKFAYFLQEDLGFKVIFELWEEERVNQNYIQWMDDAMASADKVITIWSNGAVSRWNAKPNLHMDMFTPVIVRIRSDLVRGLNRGKYEFVYFDYFAATNIPPTFLNHTIEHFELMRNFGQLFKKILNRGKLLSERDIKRNSDPSLHLHGKVLEQYIAKMRACIATSDKRLMVERGPAAADQDNNSWQITSLNLCPSNIDQVNEPNSIIHKLENGNAIMESSCNTNEVGETSFSRWKPELVPLISTDDTFEILRSINQYQCND